MWRARARLCLAGPQGWLGAALIISSSLVAQMSPAEDDGDTELKDDAVVTPMDFAADAYGRAGNPSATRH